jgi:hypothetical protein
MSEQRDEPSMMEKLQRWEWLIGRRLLHRGYITGVSAIMFLISLWAQPSDGPIPLAVYSLVVFVGGMTYAVKRWWEFNRRKKQHSYYIGTSPFEFRWLPQFFRRNRRMARFFDPLFCFLLGILTLPFSRLLGLWLMFAGGALFVIEAKVNNKTRETEMDMIDGLVHAEYQGETVDEYETAAPNRQQQQQAAIATGLGDDIKEHIKRRKSRKP